MIRAIYRFKDKELHVDLDIDATTIRVSHDSTLLFETSDDNVKVRFFMKDESQAAIITFRKKYAGGIIVMYPDDVEKLRLFFSYNPEISGNNDASFRVLLIGVVIASIAAIIFVASYLDIAAHALTNITPRHWETRLADLALNRLKTTGNICNNHEAKKSLARLAAPLIKAADIDEYPPVRMIPIKTTQQEAQFTTIPGAVTIFNDVYIRNISNSDTLAADIARHLVYIKQRRPLRQFIASTGSVALAAGLLPFLHGTESAATAASRILRADHHEHSESSADIATVMLLLRAGFRADGVLQDLISKQEASFLPTPLLDKRITALQAFLAEAPQASLQHRYATQAPLNAIDLQHARNICAD